MTGLWDAERDASEAARALAGLAALLRAETPPDPRALRSLAENGGAAAERVVAYLRRRCAPGDGEMAEAPPRLAPWRDWVPSRGHLFGVPGVDRQAGGVPQPRRCGDPGE
ncbi:hypothetical protein Aph02nite_56480 [Actinoplanes philippinensis]|uniref:Uncharacterized protein n=1 Tax=Actinoplanes philippinensis TaxID=35752 RepID=A0A1I2J4Q7_9ACTN|nr:hypothetical protein [Actinoplanes philippinensis]GIE79698.1 hypothetical protein Aph02nite_56480 [Actinoplanes philippinensis]SFF48217.1 hypothetical protein SAMN05421541_111155 [Actinoplanes philippinensis]